MTSQQELSFAAGSGVSPDTVIFAIAATLAVLSLTWVVSVVFGSFNLWRDGRIELFDVVLNALRACIVLLVFGFYLN